MLRGLYQRCVHLQRQLYLVIQVSSLSDLVPPFYIFRSAQDNDTAEQRDDVPLMDVDGPSDSVLEENIVTNALPSARSASKSSVPIPRRSSSRIKQLEESRKVKSMAEKGLHPVRTSNRSHKGNLIF